MLSVYTRHHPSCKNAGDKTWRRCNCPKWVWGSQNGQFIRQSAKTHSWEAAEELRRQLTAELTQPSRTTPEMPPNPILVAPTSMQPRVATRLLAEEITPVQPRKPRVTVENAVDAYLADARSRELESATLSKLETIFRKQFLVWSRIEGIEFLDQIDLDALLNFRNTWKDGKLAKQKKQSRLIGFFWACVRRGYIAQNPCMGLGKIKVVQIPTDYFPRDEFQRILDATHVYGDPRGGFIPIEDLRTRLRTMTLLMRWSGLRIRDAITFERHHLRKREPRSMFRSLPTWSMPSTMCRLAQSPIPATSSGAATAILRARSPTGSEAIAACSSWQTSGSQMARSSAVTRTCSATLLRSRCCSPAFPSIRSRFCSAMLQ